MAVKQKAALGGQYDRALSCVLWWVTFFTLCTTLLLVYRSRTWGLLWDAAIWHYVARLITEGAFPYRDIFDVNFPGTHIIHLFVIKCIGGGDVLWRIFDMFYPTAERTIIPKNLKLIASLQVKKPDTHVLKSAGANQHPDFLRAFQTASNYIGILMDLPNKICFVNPNNFLFIVPS